MGRPICIHQDCLLGTVEVFSDHQRTSKSFLVKMKFNLADIVSTTKGNLIALWVEATSPYESTAAAASTSRWCWLVLLDFYRFSDQRILENLQQLLHIVAHCLETDQWSMIEVLRLWTRYFRGYRYPRDKIKGAFEFQEYVS
ncbi:hypothetical protein ElyMa_006410400 [Elysia marginata]|uniref:CID domain-containing protein n=1 Tax=Elysia marginata TaxID=1093978 RepID=A0AAV4HVA7_9GAST|nr:hypothetical protein ElyMa_006410400 [Elysia marginata]